MTLTAEIPVDQVSRTDEVDVVPARPEPGLVAHCRFDGGLDAEQVAELAAR